METAAAATAAAAVTMNGGREDEMDVHGQDVVMPGFRFHPTEEELLEFYLRRKVEGKRFNVELITFLDLYRYDPWELPALAAIGEKEWFFYVPRDRKYRHGDRPNRVTTSGYWKATGADRLIRTEGSRSIGLKKTLVFYSGKAPRGIRTSWIMNEYRLPQTDKDRHGIKAEISVCRVYKRAGVVLDDQYCRLLPGAVSSGLSGSRCSSSSTTVDHDKIIIHPSCMCHRPATNFQISLAGGRDGAPSVDAEIIGKAMTHHAAAKGTNTSCQDGIAPVPRNHAANWSAPSTTPVAPLSSARRSTDDEGAAAILIHSSKEDYVDVGTSLSTPAACCDDLLASSSPNNYTPAAASVDHELNGMDVGFFGHNYPSQSQLIPHLASLPSSFTTLTSKLWDWTPRDLIPPQ